MMNKISTRFRYAVSCMTLAVASGVAAFAQSNIGNEILNSSADAIKTLISGLVRVLQLAIGIGALITLFLVILNVFKGEREAAQKIGWWVVGLALGFALLTVVANQISAV